MKTVQIGAFEAKTRFSELLRGVQRGATYEILRRGRPVARLTGGMDGDRAQRIDALIARVRAARSQSDVSVSDILEWKGEGRA